MEGWPTDDGGDCLEKLLSSDVQELFLFMVGTIVCRNDTLGESGLTRWQVYRLSLPANNIFGRSELKFLFCKFDGFARFVSDYILRYHSRSRT